MVKPLIVRLVGLSVASSNSRFTYRKIKDESNNQLNMPCEQNSLVILAIV